MARKRKAPVRTVKKNAASNPAKEKAPVPPPQAKEEPTVPETPVVPEKKEESSNVIPINPKAVIEDPAAVFKLCMLEADMEKVQLKMQLEARQAAEQIQQIIVRRDQNIAKYQSQFQNLRGRHIQFKEHIEEKHGISINHYLYDDELGVFKLNQKVKEQSEQNQGVAKKKEESDG